MILVLAYALGMSAPVANLISFVAAAIPSYHFTRRWTFASRGPTRWLREVVPFWGFSALHLAASTASATIAELVVDTLPGTRFVHGLLISAAVVLTGFALWVLKYFALRATFTRS